MSLYPMYRNPFANGRADPAPTGLVKPERSCTAGKLFFIAIFFRLLPDEKFRLHIPLPAPTGRKNPVFHSVSGSYRAKNPICHSAPGFCRAKKYHLSRRGGVYPPAPKKFAQLSRRETHFEHLLSRSRRSKQPVKPPRRPNADAACPAHNIKNNNEGDKFPHESDQGSFACPLRRR